MSSEQCAIRFYSETVEKCGLTDLVAHELLEDEVECERFLAKYDRQR